MAESHSEFAQHMAERARRIETAQTSLTMTPQDWVPYERYTLTRDDLRIRTAARDIIASVVQNDEMDPEEGVAALEECKEQCQRGGVPFSELLKGGNGSLWRSALAL